MKKFTQNILVVEWGWGCDDILKPNANSRRPMCYSGCAKTVSRLP